MREQVSEDIFFMYVYFMDIWRLMFGDPPRWWWCIVQFPGYILGTVSCTTNGEKVTRFPTPRWPRREISNGTVCYPWSFGHNVPKVHYGHWSVVMLCNRRGEITCAEVENVDSPPRASTEGGGGVGKPDHGSLSLGSWRLSTTTALLLLHVTKHTHSLSHTARPRFLESWSGPKCI